MKENRGAAELFMACQSQWRVGFGCVLGLDYGVLKHAAEWLDVCLDKKCFEKIRVLERISLEKLYREKENG